MSTHSGRNGNGKMTGLCSQGEAFQGTIRPNCHPRLSDAVAWLRACNHVPSCQCVRCTVSRNTARDAVRRRDCSCGQCARCWAADQIKAGRL